MAWAEFLVGKAQLLSRLAADINDRQEKALLRLGRKRICGSLRAIMIGYM